jgi:hypothetical protein
LGNVISKDGILVDLERKKVILQIPPQHRKKSMESFFGRINFVRRFIPYFTEIVNLLQRMIKRTFNLNGHQWRKNHLKISNPP